MELEKKRSEPIELAKKAVIKIIKDEFDAQLKAGLHSTVQVPWRTNFINKLSDPLTKLKTENCLKYQAVTQNEANCKDKTVKSLEDIMKQTITECIIESWYKIRHRKNLRTQTLLGHQLVFLASDRQLLGEGALRLRLPYLTDRKTVVRLGTEKDLGLDDALAIRDHCIFNKYPEIIQNKQVGEQDAMSDEELDCAARLGVLLCWEGLSYGFIRGLMGVSFDCSNGKNVLFLKTGRSYRIFSLSRFAWSIIGGMSKKLHKFFDDTNLKKVKTLEDTYPDLRQRMRSIVRSAGRQFSIPSKRTTLEKFRQMGVYYKLRAYGCSPASLSEITTSEQSTNVISPAMIYPGYMPKTVKLAPETNIKVQEVGQDDEDDSAIVDLGGYFSDLMENINNSHAVIQKYMQDADRERAIGELEKYLKEQPESKIIRFAKYILEAKTKRGRKMVAESALKYFLFVKELFVVRILTERDEMYTEDLLSVIFECNLQDSESLLNKSSFKGFRAAYRHYEDCLKEYGVVMPKVKWSRIMRYCDPSCRLIVLPEENKVVELIKALLGSKNEFTFDMAVLIALAFYGGLRCSEAYSFECARLYCVGFGEYYIEITGKFDKSRRVDLSLLPFEYRELLVMMVENALKNGRTELFGKENEETYKNQFNEHCREAIPSGMHSLRHCFTVRQIVAGVDIKKVSSMLGHESIRVTKNTYDGSAYIILGNQMAEYRYEKELITREETMGVLCQTPEGAKKYVKKNNVTSILQQNAYCRGGGKRVYDNCSQLLNKGFETMAQRTAKVRVKSREVFLWMTYFRNRVKMSVEQRKDFLKSLKSNCSLKQGYQESLKKAS